jgi:hypothetical protein
MSSGVDDLGQQWLTDSGTANRMRERWTTRLCVEDCVHLCVKELRRYGVFAGAFGSQWILNRNNDDRCLETIIHFSVIEYPRYALALNITDALGGNGTTRPAIPVTTSVPHFGGRRFWFKCPSCGRRVGRLYRPWEQSKFACRGCHYLTYRTSQTHNKRIDALRRNPLALLVALNSKKPKHALLGIRACVQVVARLTKLYSNI